MTAPKFLDAAAEAARRANADKAPQEEHQEWGEPDLGVLRLNRRAPPSLPLQVFGPWGEWIVEAAEAAASPPDYVATPLLASSSALVGHARWAMATPGWAEPPHLWLASVGDSGDSKSPGADCLMRDVLPVLEQRMSVDYPDQLQQWRVQVELAKAAEERWRSEVKTAEKRGLPGPPPPECPPPEPQAPRLRQHDVTIERMATLLATAAPKGLFVVRDELAGLIAGMVAYNDAGRQFWVEAYGGRPYRVERQKHAEKHVEPIDIPRLAVAVYGGTQPEKLAELMRDADDGMLARLLWAWPDAIPFRLGRAVPAANWAIEALDRLRRLELQPGDPPQPVMVPLSARGRDMMESFGREMQDRKAFAGGLLRSAIGKMRGQALRLALVLENLWCCGSPDTEPPVIISDRAFAAAAHLVSDYFLPMAERVYGDAAAPKDARNAATFARWIMKERPDEVHVRHLQREVRLPGLQKAEDIHAAAAILVEANLLAAPTPGTEFGQRGRAAYCVNPALKGVQP
jgi:hypothetical protein